MTMVSNIRPATVCVSHPVSPACGANYSHLKPCECAKGAKVAAMATERIFEEVSAKRAQGPGVSAEKAAEALGAELTALTAEAVAEAMAAEKVRVKEELLSQLSQLSQLSHFLVLFTFDFNSVN